MLEPESEIFLGGEKKNQSSAVKSLCVIVEYIMENLVRTFERFLMTNLSARSNLVIIYQKKSYFKSL